MTEQEVGRILEDLVEMLEDGRKGFSEAADDLAQGGHHEIANELRRFSSQRARFSSQLRDLAVAHGFVIQQSGSMAGTLHRRWLAVRDTFTTDKVAAALAAADQGEAHAQQDYEKALAQPLPDEIRSVVAQQVGEVEATRERLRALREASPA